MEKEELSQLKARRDRELNKVTALLCEVCEELFTDDEDLMQIALAAARVKGLKKWWESHQKRDAERDENL